MMVEDLVQMTPLAKMMLGSERIFAFQDNEKHNGRRYAKISIDKEERLFLHALASRECLPKDASLLKHEDLMKTVDASSRLTFLDLGVEDATLGRIFIRLAPNTYFARQFTLLCTGELGPSYAKTNVLKVMYPNGWLESVFFGDYEQNDGSGGKALVVGPNWDVEHTKPVYKRRWRAGLIGGWGWTEEKASQFAIHTRDCKEVELPGCFGIVEEGLGVLTKALVKLPDMTKVYVRDCGIVLPRS